MSSTIIGTSIGNSQYVGIEGKELLQSFYVIGSTGKGKSTLLENCILQDIVNRTGVCLIDAHGDLVDGVIAKLPLQPDNLIVLDIQNPNNQFGLNMFACANPHDDLLVTSIVSQIMAIFQRLFDITRQNPRMSQQLRNASRTLIANQGHTLLEIPLLFTDVKFRRKLLTNITDPTVRRFWATYESMKPNEQRDYADSILNKLEEFLQPPASNIVGQARTTIDFREIMDAGKVVLIKLNPKTQDVSSLIGSLIISKILTATYSRANLPPNMRRPFNLYVDEFQKFATKDFHSLLTEGRKYGVAVIMAHQTREQLDAELQAATVNAGNIAMFRISGQDAEDMAKEVDSTPKEEVRIARDRALLSPIRDAITHLINKGHNNPDVVRFTSKYLVRYMETYEKYKDYGVVLIHQGTIDEYRLSAPYFRDSIYELNQLFYETMAQNNPHLPLPPIVVFTFASYYGFVNGLPRDAYREKRRTNFHPKFIPQNITLLCDPDAVQSYPAIKQAIFDHNRGVFGANKPPKKYLLEETAACEEFLTSIRNVLAILAKDPILVDTGQHEHIYERPRAYADVQNEMATKLSNLDDFTMYVKLTKNHKAIEELVRILSPVKECDPQELQYRLAWLEAQNVHSGYLRPKWVIEQEVLNRFPTTFMEPMTQALPVMPKNPI